eukprot:7991944-Heterocapsa_arctica.AAC.1
MHKPFPIGGACSATPRSMRQWTGWIVALVDHEQDHPCEQWPGRVMNTVLNGLPNHRSTKTQSSLCWRC